MLHISSASDGRFKCFTLYSITFMIDTTHYVSWVIDDTHKHTPHTDIQINTFREKRVFHVSVTFNRLILSIIFTCSALHRLYFFFNSNDQSFRVLWNRKTGLLFLSLRMCCRTDASSNKNNNCRLLHSISLSLSPSLVYGEWWYIWRAFHLLCLQRKHISRTKYVTVAVHQLMPQHLSFTLLHCFKW